jgi:hypothetical protein
VDCVTDAVEDWRDTCQEHGRRVWSMILMELSVVEPQNHLLLRMVGFATFGPQHSVTRFEQTD